MSHFGPRVIGSEKHAEAEIIEKARANHFGSRVIGKIFEKVPAPAAEAKDTRSDPAKKAAKRQGPERIEAPVTANLQELEAALNGNPMFYEPLFQAELGRAEGPRKGALRIFLAHELALDSGPRETRMDEIEGLLS